MIRKHPVFSLFSACFLLIFFPACKPELKAPVPVAGSANFSRSIAVGGDFMAGYQDGALYLDGQNRSIPALLARSFQSVGGSAFRQVLMPDDKGLGLNLKPWQSLFVQASVLGMKTNCQDVTSLTPIVSVLSGSNAGPYLAGTSGNAVQNLSVPFATTAQLFDPALGLSYYSGNKNPYYNRFAAYVGQSTVFGDAKNANASFFSVWVGMEDIFNYASCGGTNSSIAYPSSFGSNLDTLLNGLTTNGAKGIIATIPDFRSFPLYTLIPYNGAVLTQATADSLNSVCASQGYTNLNFLAGNNAFLVSAPGQFTTFRQLHPGEYVLSDVPCDSIRCHYLGLLPHTPLSNCYVLDSSEVAFIDANIAAYNSLILQKASLYGVAVVDMNAYFRTVKTGVKWNGVNYSSEFISGGFFSLDGYHPNQQGYALIANQFVLAINQSYKSTLPWINCTDCNGILFP